MHEKWFVIVNPLAGGGKGKVEWPKIKLLLIEKGLNFDFRITQYKCHAIELTAWAVESGYRKIVAVGGDGTLNEVVNGLFSQQDVPVTEVLIAMIGVGTGNDWQRMFASVNSVEESITALQKPVKLLQDVGLAEYYEDGKVCSRYFVNAAGVGFDAEVTRNTNKLKEKGRQGKILYMLSLLKTLISYKSSNINIAIDNKEVGGKVFSITIGIGKFNGGGMMQLPDAVADDGLFDITVIREVKRMEVIRNVPKLYNGTILTHPKISGYKGSVVTISSDVVTTLEVDGESLGQAPFRFSVLKQAVKVVINSNYELN